MMKPNTTPEPLSAGKLRAQTNLLDTAARQVLSGSFGRKFPADRILSTYFRENRCCGSRDRALISETVYALLRYWGFLRKYLPENRRNDIECGSIRLTKQELGALLTAGVFIAGEEERADMLANAFQLHTLPHPAGSPERRARQLTDYFATDTSIALTDILPQWICDNLPENLDRDAFLRSLSVRPPMWLRLQLSDPAERDSVIEELVSGGAEVSVSQTLPDALMVRAKMNLFTLDSFRNGKFEIQDLASQCVGCVCDAKQGERWLDACAGAGGKTLQLAQAMNRKGSVTASDLRDYKLEDLRRRARRAGFPNIITKPHSAGLKKPKHPYHGVLIDAPCSCSGVWRRNPGAQWKLTAEEITELAACQYGILSEYADAVRPGGVLVYATCSLFDEEDSQVVTKFLSGHPDFKLDPFEDPIEKNIAPGMLRIDGCKYDCDTLFVAKMRKVN